MEDEAITVTIKEIIELKPTMYCFLVDDSSEHKKAKVMNKNVVVTISHNEYNDALLNNKCLRLLMNRNQIKSRRITTCGVINISLKYFDDKIYILNNECDGLARGCGS